MCECDEAALGERLWLSLMSAGGVKAGEQLVACPVGGRGRRRCRSSWGGTSGFDGNGRGNNGLAGGV